MKWLAPVLFILLWYWFTIALGCMLESVGLSSPRVGSVVLPLGFLGFLGAVVWADKLTSSK